MIVEEYLWVEPGENIVQYVRVGDLLRPHRSSRNTPFARVVRLDTDSVTLEGPDGSQIIIRDIRVWERRVELT